MTPLELKQAFKVMEARVKVLEAEVTALRNRVGALEAKPQAVEYVGKPAIWEPEKPKRKMCPKCGKKPDFFFHVRSCSG